MDQIIELLQKKHLAEIEIYRNLATRQEIQELDTKILELVGLEDTGIIKQILQDIEKLKQQLADSTKIPLVSIEVVPAFVVVEHGEVIDLSLIFSPQNATDTEGEWISTDPQTATVSNTGQLVTIKAGTCIIKYTSGEVESNECIVEVQEKEEVVEVDQDVQNFIDKVPTLSEKEVTSVNTFISNIKQNNIWEKLQAVYLFLGGNESAHTLNLIDPRDDNNAFRLTFQGNVEHSPNGVNGNKQGYANTYYNPQLHGNANDSHIAMYAGTVGQTSKEIDLGVLGSNQGERFSMESSFQGNFAADLYSIEGGRVSYPNDDSKGFYIASRTLDSILRTYKNGELRAVNDTLAPATLPNLEVPIMAWNNKGTVSTNLGSTKDFRFVSIGRGLGEEEAIALSQAVEQLQKDLNRSAYTEDITPPTKPTNLRKETSSENTVTVAWDDSIDNDLAIKYNVYVNKEVVKTISSNRTTITDLTPSTSYEISIDAVDSAGNISELSEAITVTTTNQIQNPPTSKVKAFPTAYGGGAYASGGRGGNVFHVTTLNPSGPGSIQEAIQNPNTTVVFDVSGVIEIPFNWRINVDNLTIAGQSAPEGGITLTFVGNTSPEVEICENVIIRYLRVRGNFVNENVAFRVHPSANNTTRYSRNHIFDHMSINYSGGQAFSVTKEDTHNITFQNGLIAESKTGALFGDTGPDNAGFSYDNTFRTTLFYNIPHRTPNSSSGRADIYNNVIYDWTNRWSTFKTNALVNHFNNYYFKGNKTALFTQWQSEPQVWQVNGVTNENPSLPPSIYATGNIAQDLFEDPLADNQFLFIEHAYSGQTERVDSPLFRTTIHPMIGAVPNNIMTATEASIAVPLNAGANKYLNADGTFGIYRDASDTRYISNVINDTPESFSCCNSGPANNRHSAMGDQAYQDFLNTITGTPINTRPANFYNPAKSEHIPEAFYDLYMPVGSSHNDIAPSGYTWLEEYLNQVDSKTPQTTDPIDPTEYPKNLAFPTALGGGANSRSTQDYSIYEVTNLNSLGPGSLWEGMRQSNVIIVFKVGGIISMNEAEQTSYSNGSNNIMVLGQTAPSPGITVVGNGFKYVSGENIIMRYMRFRQWRCRTELHAPCSADVIDHIDSNNIIYDHCSFAYGGDESLSTRGASTNFTLSNSIVSYGLSGGLFGDSSDYTLGDNYSSIGNLWHTVGKRTPNPNGNGRFDILGNVTYNILNLAMRTGGDVKLNEIGNYYKYTLRSHMATSETPSIFTQNNRSTQYNLTTNNQDNQVIWQDRDNNTGTAISQYFTETMHPLLNYDIPLIDGDAAYLRVTNREMGANKYLDNNGNAVTYVDDLDLVAFTEFDNDTRFDWKDSTGLVSANPDNRTQSNYRVIPQRSWLTTNEPNFGVVVNEHSQTTHTGVVPNVWITAQGLTPATFNPLGNDLNATYTNIEMYSFGVDSVGNFY